MSPPALEVLLVRMCVEPVGDVPAYGIHLPVAAGFDIGDRAGDDLGRVAPPSEGRDRERPGQRDGASVVAVVEHADQYTVVGAGVARGVLLVGQLESRRMCGNAHAVTLRRVTTRRTTRFDTAGHRRK